MILITGATGLVGSHLLAKILPTQGEVKALYRNTSKLEKVRNVLKSYFPKDYEQQWKKIKWQKADVADIPALEQAFYGVSHVYHCAALISMDPTKYHELRKVNFEGTANVVNLCITKGIKKLCYVSSIATFDKGTGINSIDENSHWNPEKSHNPYAITKYGGEMEVWRAGQEGISVVIVNPGIIIGTGHWNSGSGKLFSQVYRGLKFHVPKTTGFIGIWDVVEAMKLLMESPIKNEQFILVSQNLSFSYILCEIAHSLQKPAPKIKLKPWMARLGWLYEKTVGKLFGRDRIFSKSVIKSSHEKTFYTSKKFEDRFQYKFQEISPVIQKTGAQFKEEIK